MPITTCVSYRSYAELLAQGRLELGQVPCPRCGMLLER